MLLAKCGADMTRVRFINEDEKQLSMTDDRIEKAIRQNSVRLMIMDPIQAYLGANVDMNRANEIRPLFRHLSTIAERTGCKKAAGKQIELILQKYSSFYLPKVVAITGHKSEHRMTPKTLENSHFWQKESALWQDQI